MIITYRRERESTEGETAEKIEWENLCLLLELDNNNLTTYNIEHSTFNIYLLTLCIRVVLSASMGSSNTSALSRPNIIAEINQILRIIQGDAKLVPIDQSQATGLDLQKKMIQWSHLSSRSSIRERFDFVLVRRQTLGIYLLEIYKNNRHRKSKVKGLNKCLPMYLLILFP